MLGNALFDVAMQGEWTLSPQQSSVRFMNKTLWGLVPVKGRFAEFAGRGRMERGGAVSGRLTISVASVETGIAKRDKHLRAADFFDAERFPEIIIDVARVAPGAGPLVDVAATATIRGITLPLPLHVTVNNASAETIAVNARTEIDRTKWGVGASPLGMIPTTTSLDADLTFVH